MTLSKHVDRWALVLASAAVVAAFMNWSPAFGSDDSPIASTASDAAIMRELRTLKREVRALRGDVRAAESAARKASTEAFNIKLAVTSQFSDRSLYSLTESIKSEVGSIKQFGHP